MHCPRHAFQFDYRVLYCLHAALCTVLLKRAGTARNGTPNSTQHSTLDVLYCTRVVLCASRCHPRDRIASFSFRFFSFAQQTSSPSASHCIAAVASASSRRPLPHTRRTYVRSTTVHIYSTVQQYNNYCSFEFIHLLPPAAAHIRLQCSPVQSSAVHRGKVGADSAP